jgi:hypothetical protein
MRDDMKADFGFELWVAMVLQADLKTFRWGRRDQRRFGLDLFHQPTGTVQFGLPIDGRGWRSSYRAANISATLLNFHVFRKHSKEDLLEIGLLQEGIGSQVDLSGVSKFQVQEGLLTIEGHLTDKVSIIGTTAWTRTRPRLSTLVSYSMAAT